jgi:hypothetical protein
MSTSASKENATATESNLDPMETALRQAAQGVDNGEEVTDDAILRASGEKEAGKPAGGKAGKDKASESNEQGDGTAPDADEDPKPAGQAPDKKPGKDTTKPGDQQQQQQQQETPEQKAQKERERFARNREELYQRHEEFKRLRADLDARERALIDREQRIRAAQAARPAGPIKDQHGFTAAQYEKYAEEAEKRGKFDLADEAKAAAKALREQEQQASQQRGQPDAGADLFHDAKPDERPGTPEFNAAWQRHLQELEGSKEFADLKNRDSALFKTTAGILHAQPRLSMFNDGIRLAAEIARMKLDAGAVPDLRTKLEEANKELEKLRKATSPGASGGESRGAAAKPFEEMTTAEQEAHLKKAAAEVDQGG